MNGTVENTNEVVETVVERVRPYKLRDLCSDDIFPMLTIIRKIGIKEFKECFNKETIEKIVELFMNNAKPEKEGENAQENTLVVAGISMLPTVFDIAEVLLNNIPKCENDVYKFLANVSDLSVDKIKKLKMADFMGMIVDVIKKDDFKDFFKVVSELFK